MTCFLVLFAYFCLTSNRSGCVGYNCIKSVQRRCWVNTKKVYYRKIEIRSYLKNLKFIITIGGFIYKQRHVPVRLKINLIGKVQSTKMTNSCYVIKFYVLSRLGSPQNFFLILNVKLSYYYYGNFLNVFTQNKFLICVCDQKFSLVIDCRERET